MIRDCGKHLNPASPQRVVILSASTKMREGPQRLLQLTRKLLRRAQYFTPSSLPPTPPPPASPSSRWYSPSRPISRTAALAPPKSFANPPLPTGFPPLAVCLPAQSPVACDPPPSPSTRPCSTHSSVSKKSPAHSQCFRPSPAQIVHSSPARAPAPRAPCDEIPPAHTNRTPCSTSRHSPA